MKTIVRAFIVVLAITGAAASSQISSASTSGSAKIAAKTSALPIPMCAPDDPDACGITGSRK